MVLVFVATSSPTSYIDVTAKSGGGGDDERFVVRIHRGDAGTARKKAIRAFHGVLRVHGAGDLVKGIDRDRASGCGDFPVGFVAEPLARAMAVLSDHGNHRAAGNRSAMACPGGPGESRFPEFLLLSRALATVHHDGPRSLRAVVVFPADFGDWNGAVDGIFARIGERDMEKNKRELFDVGAVGTGWCDRYSVYGGEL